MKLRILLMKLTPYTPFSVVQPSLRQHLLSILKPIFNVMPLTFFFLFVIEKYSQETLHSSG